MSSTYMHELCVCAHAYMLACTYEVMDVSCVCVCVRLCLVVCTYSMGTSHKLHVYMVACIHVICVCVCVMSVVACTCSVGSWHVMSV